MGIRAFGRRCVKLDVKGFSRAKNKFTDITSDEDDLPFYGGLEAMPCDGREILDGSCIDLSTQPDLHIQSVL